MGGIVDPVGVVSEPKPEKQVVVDHPAPPRRRRHTSFPWESTHPTPVPFSSQTYTFDWNHGEITVLPQQWFHKQDEDNKVVASKANPIPDANAQGFPEFDFATAQAMQEYAWKNDVPLNIAFCKVFPTDKLTREDMENIAMSPDQYVRKPLELIQEIDRKKKAADFFKKLEKAK